ncbi:hypothetical protein BGZ49_001001 [Haplosporangium sp. Z 27]|nr:hypothetical protein BGZ49_001001 [Haplosporangium sp. Z 27]
MKSRKGLDFLTAGAALRKKILYLWHCIAIAADTALLSAALRKKILYLWHCIAIAADTALLSSTEEAAKAQHTFSRTLSPSPYPLNCLVDGLPTSRAFSADFLCRDCWRSQGPDQDDITVDQLILWCVSIPDDDDEIFMLPDNVPEKKKLKATAKLSKVFDSAILEDTIHIIVQRLALVHASVPTRALTPVSIHALDDSCPGTSLSGTFGDLSADIKKIADKFFAPGFSASIFLDSYVRGERILPVTTTGIKRLPKVLRRGIVDMDQVFFFGSTEPSSEGWEEIIKTGDPEKWKTVINDTEIMLTSWKERERRGNLCGKLVRFRPNTKWRNIQRLPKDIFIRDTLGLFLFRYNLLDVTEIVLENEAYLVEAVFGRIKLFGGTARTVIDEPFVLKQSRLFSRKEILYSWLQQNGLCSLNERLTMMPAVFIETFKIRPLSTWPLLTDNALPDSLTDDLRQVLKGSDVENALATVSGNIIRGKMEKEHEKTLEEQSQDDKKVNQKEDSTKV